MASGPSSAWRLTDEQSTRGTDDDNVDDEPPDTIYSGTGLYEFALYYKLAGRPAPEGPGWTPRQVDDLYDWEFRAVFGLDDVPLPGTETADVAGPTAVDDDGRPIGTRGSRRRSRRGPHRPGGGTVASGGKRRDLVAERAAHAAGRAAKPEPDAVGDSERVGVTTLIERLSTSTE